MNLFKLGNKYCKESDWKDIALLKLCLFSIGLICGVLLASNYKVETLLIATPIFVITYITILRKVIHIWKENKNK